MSDTSGIEPRAKEQAYATEAYADAVAAAAKVGGTVITFTQGAANAWGGAQCIGIVPQASKASPSDSTNGVVPFIVPAPGKIKMMQVRGCSVNSGSANVRVQKAAGGGASLTYNNTSLVAPLNSTNFSEDITNIETVAKGDALCAYQSGGLWTHFGVAVCVLYIPDQV